MTTEALANNSGTADADDTQYGFDCIIIPGAQGPTIAAGDPDITQADADLTATLNTATGASMAWPPQICGSGAGIGIGSTTTVITGSFLDFDGGDENLTICSKFTISIAAFQSLNYGSLQYA